MFKRILSFMLVILLLQMTSFTVSANTKNKVENNIARATKIKAQVVKLGQQANVKVQFTNNTKLKGVVSSIEEEYFVLTDYTNRKDTTVAYADVKEVKKNNLSTANKIGIGALIAGAIVGIIVLATRRRETRSGTPCPLIYPERCP